MRGSSLASGAVGVVLTFIAGCAPQSPPAKSAAAATTVETAAPIRGSQAGASRHPKKTTELKTLDELQRSQSVAGPLECGEASYYADSLAGNKTASGEPYDPDLATAAHKTLPLGAMIKVARRGGGSEVVVKVNDRGPYAHGRIIDLSRSAAAALGLVRDGVGEVCISKLDP